MAPTSVVPNWLREIEKFAPTLNAVAWHGPDREKQLDKLEDADVVITSYALVRRDEEFFQKRAVLLRDPRRGAAHQEPDERDRARGQEAARASAGWR